MLYKIMFIFIYINAAYVYIYRHYKTEILKDIYYAFKKRM